MFSMIRYVLFHLLISLAGEKVCSAWFWNHFFALSKSACGGLVRPVRHFVQPCRLITIFEFNKAIDNNVTSTVVYEFCSHRNGKVVMMIALLVTEDVEGTLPQWWSGHSPWWPFCFCELWRIISWLSLTHFPLVLQICINELGQH